MSFGSSQLFGAGQRIITPQSVEAFFDVAFETQKLDHELVGVAVSVVKDGEVLLKKGYGFADLERRIAVDPDKHLFRIASISKTFTWTAIMQLVEQGKLDLEADIQTYIDFDIPKTFAEPIRLKHLLTHSAGFEEVAVGGFAENSEDVLALIDYLPAHIPARVRKPGTYISYSNYGSALAGYIVERVSGIAWALYIQKNILDPLAMTETNIHQPMSAAHQGAHARGYKFENGQYRATDYWFEQEAPAGIISSTAGNMVNWMLTHLNGGLFNNVSILKPETVERMQSALFLQHPDAQPVLHGFYRSDRNGVLVFGHGGDVNQFHSNLSFIPEHNLGIFVSYNSDPSSRARSNVVAAFLDYFFSADFPENIEPDLSVNLDDYVGEWASTRRNHSTFEKLALLTSGMKMTSSDNELVLASGSSVSRWIPVGNEKFRAKYSNRYLLFYRDDLIDGAVDDAVDDEMGAVTHFSGDSGVGSFERIRWYEARNLHLLLFGSIVLLALAYLGRFAYKLILLRNNENGLSPLDQWLAAANSVIMLFLNYRLVVALTTNTDQFLYGVPTSVQFTFTMALVSVPFAIAVNLLAIRQWMGSRGSLLARLNYGLFGLASLLFVFLLWFWNILNFYF